LLLQSIIKLAMNSLISLTKPIDKIIKYITNFKLFILALWLTEAIIYHFFYGFFPTMVQYIFVSTLLTQAIMLICTSVIKNKISYKFEANSQHDKIGMFLILNGIDEFSNLKYFIGFEWLLGINCFSTGNT